MATFTIEQFVEHTNKYEPMDNGDFDTLEAAEKAMNELVTACGFFDLRIVDEDGDVVADTSEEIDTKFLNAKAKSENCVVCVYRVGDVEVEVEWSNIHPGTGEIGEFDLQNSVKSSLTPTRFYKNSYIAERVEAAILRGETNDNHDIDLYLTIRDSFNANDCAELVEETFGDGE